MYYAAAAAITLFIDTRLFSHALRHAIIDVYAVRDAIPLLLIFTIAIIH